MGPRLYGQIYAYQKNYFDFSIKSPLLNSKNELRVEMKYNLNGYEEERFKVRPVSEDGFVLSGLDNWTNMPSIKKEFKVKILGLGRVATKLYFQIQDTRENII